MYPYLLANDWTDNHGLDTALIKSEFVTYFPAQALKKALIKSTKINA